MYENLYYAQRATNITNTYITQKAKINKYKESSVNLPTGDTIYIPIYLYVGTITFTAAYINSYLKNNI
jgi:hypothetical protein